MLTEIEQLWEDETRRKRELWGYYAVGHRMNNQKLHNSALSPNTAARQSGFDEEGDLVIRLGASPTDDEAATIPSLDGAMFTYGRMARLNHQGDRRRRRRLGSLLRAATRPRLQARTEAPASHRGNDQCPCDSGKKYKVCHGA